MTFEAALRAELITISDLQDKVFPMRAPEGTEAPYLIYTTTLGDYDKSLEGWHKSKGVTVELNVIHDRAAAVRALSREVQALVMGLEGKQLASTGPHINEIVFEGEGVELYEAQADVYRKVISFKTYFKEE